jgi:hypothetical protein
MSQNQTENLKMDTEKCKNTKKQLILDIVKEAMATTSSYGFPFIAKAELLALKIMWIVAMLFLTALAIKYSIDALVSYLDFDVVTRFQVINESPAIFPTVSICELVFSKIKIFK